MKYISVIAAIRSLVWSVGCMGYVHTVSQACQTEGPPRATWVTFVLS